MTLRTPRRRISPRAKRRYRVIRDFFRRALGGASQQDIKINSSIAVNVTDLKHKIVGIEHQLNDVSRHCQDLAYMESTIRKGEKLLVPGCSCCQHDIACSAHTSNEPEQRSSCSATRVLYRPLDTLRRKSDESDYISVNCRNSEHRKHMTLPTSKSHEYSYPHLAKLRQRKNKVDDKIHVVYEPRLEKHRTRSAMENYASCPSCATTSYHSVVPAPAHTERPGPPPPRSPRSAHLAPAGRRHERRRDKHRDYADAMIHEDLARKKYKQHRRHKSASPQRYHEEKLDHFREYKNERCRKGKSKTKVDQDFIAEIIQKQYKPMKVFGRRYSDLSQFSMPVCRDQEYSVYESIQEGTDLCSCCYGPEARRSPHRHRRPHYDCQSVCDTRLYSSKRTRPSRRYRHVDIYNDATLYDVVPVKEKPSPKSRRRFVEDDILGYEHYKEVPPSPRTHRPRLNLIAQRHADYEEYLMMKHAARGCSPERHRRYYDYNHYYNGEEVAAEAIHEKERTNVKPAKVQTHNHLNHNNGSMTNLNTHFDNDPAVTSVFNSFNKTQETMASDKTDKALCEIKDILQCFLQEIKKEAAPQMSDKGEDTQQASRAQQLAGPPTMPSYTVAQCSVPTTFPVPPFNNPYCYPMLPICPCKSFIAQSPSCTCHGYPNKDTDCQGLQKKETEAVKNTETEELIKEIYKFVTLSPQMSRKKNSRVIDRKEKKPMTSRSVGGSSRMSQHDANVATSEMKCYSKSCEAIGSRMLGETSYTTTQSETMLEKLSLDVTRSDSELTTEVNLRRKPKSTNKFKNVLRLIGLKKKKTEGTESSFEVEVSPKERPPPFRHEHDMYDYSMYPQEYYQPNAPYGPQYDQYGYVPPPPGCEHRGPYYAQPAPPGTYTPHRIHEQTIPEHEPHYNPPPHSHVPPSRSHNARLPPLVPPSHPHSYHRSHPSAPYPDPYDHHYHHSQPQGPLCLKEVEVKSTGTQSERKISFLRKLSRKTPPGTSVRSSSVHAPPPRHAEVQTNPPPQSKSSSEPLNPKVSGWKRFQEKVKTDLSQDPLMYGYNTKQKLLNGDKNLKSAMVKKMFYKRNPFSPNNLIIRTLLGNDPSSFGEPNITLKPRLFF